MFLDTTVSNTVQKAGACTDKRVIFYLFLFIQDICIAPLQVNYYSEALNTAQILCRSFTLKHHMQLRTKDLHKVPTWRLEQDSSTTFQTKGVESTNEPPHPMIGLRKWHNFC